MAKAEKLLERMRASKADWGHDDLDSLYRGFGFICREGKHSIYKHPKYPYLRAAVARHSRLAVGYIEEAIDIIDKLKEMEKKTK